MNKPLLTAPLILLTACSSSVVKATPDVVQTPTPVAQITSTVTAKTFVPEEGSAPGCQLPDSFPRQGLVDRFLQINLGDSVAQVQQTMEAAADLGYQSHEPTDPSIGSMQWTLSEPDPYMQLYAEFKDRQLDYRELRVSSATQNGDQLCYWVVED